jgi:hypothetical protein
MKAQKQLRLSCGQMKTVKWRWDLFSHLSRDSLNVSESTNHAMNDVNRVILTHFTTPAIVFTLRIGWTGPIKLESFFLSLRSWWSLVSILRLWQMLFIVRIVVLCNHPPSTCYSSSFPQKWRYFNWNGYSPFIFLSVPFLWIVLFKGVQLMGTPYMTT